MKEKVERFFNDFGKDTLDLVDSFYDHDILFEDPLARIEGRDKLRAYYEHMYRNVTDIRFDFSRTTVEGNLYSGAWRMFLKAKGLAGGDEIAVDGLSLIEFEPATGLAVYHRDYFDLDAFVYRHIPVVSSVLAVIKKKLHGPG